MDSVKQAGTAELRAQYQALLAQIAKLKAELEPLKNELVERDNRSTHILNAVMEGKQAMLRATGISAEEIAEAESTFQAMRAEKLARKAAAAAAEVGQ